MAGLACASLAWLLLLNLQLPPLPAIVLLLAAAAVPMWLLEARRHPYSDPPQVLPNHSSAQDMRSVRLLGLLGVAALFALSIAMQSYLAEDWIGGLYAWMLPALPVLGALSLWHVFRRTRTPSSIEELGAAIQRTWSSRRFDKEAGQNLLGWLVKAFFLPLMMAWSYVWLAQASDQQFHSIGVMRYFTAGMAWLYAIDTAFATIGYMSTSSRIGAQIRSVDATVLGWLSALVCYPPLSLVVLRYWLEYKDGLQWDQWLHGSPILATLWGIAILLLTSIYTWASVAFGPRFSNLTHRGIITTGPYRFSKHPAYICKNLSWWLISVPFVSQVSQTAAVLNCLALLAVNGIYWLRAKTEERHLMHDETYQRYAAWVAQYGLIGRCRRFLIRQAN